MSRYRIFILVLLALTGFTSACDDEPPRAETVTVAPSTAELTAVDATVQLSTEVLDQYGDVMAGVSVSWSSSAAPAATVDASGLVTAVGNGTATITATAGEASGSAAVSVMQSAASVMVSPSAATVEFRDTVRLTAEAFDKNGHVVAGAEFTWSSSDALVATVDKSGLVRGVGAGAATITATAEAAGGRAEITVTDPDRLVLEALYNATDGPNWVNKLNWLSDSPLGEWYGVETDSSGSVFQVNLKRNQLSGPIPPELGDLANLWWLFLQDNQLSGPIPPELGNLANLKGVYVGDNQLSGPIPPELGRLANLGDLHLWGNQLSGPIPPELGNLANLTILSLAKNQLSGPIPPELGNLANLGWLYLQDNQLSGPIPPELGNLANLKGAELYLSGNQLSGPIPPELGNLANLAHLLLANNQLSGPIPPELGNLANLFTLRLANNQLSGPIPPELGNLANLGRLYLQDNQLSGPIPPELGNLANLGRLELFGNQLSGPIPPELGNMRQMAELYLYGNALSGPLPESLGDLTELAYLHLHNNNLTGPVPAEFGRMSRLEELILSDNEEMAGPLPSEMTSLGQLRVLLAEGTKLCAPPDSVFQTWLEGVDNHRIATCPDGDPPPMADLAMEQADLAAALGAASGLGGRLQPRDPGRRRVEALTDGPRPAPTTDSAAGRKVMPRASLARRLANRSGYPEIALCHGLRYPASRREHERHRLRHRLARERKAIAEVASQNRGHVDQAERLAHQDMTPCRLRHQPRSQMPLRHVPHVHDRELQLGGAELVVAAAEIPHDEHALRRRVRA